jgi:hypothetical protein
MERHLAERDWKGLRALHPVALDSFCECVLAEIAATMSDTSRGNHERYLAVCKLIEDRDHQLQNAFDDMRRRLRRKRQALVQHCVRQRRHRTPPAASL